MEYFVITEATINHQTTFDGYEILLDIDFITDLPTHRRFTIRYSDTLMKLNPDFIFEDRDFFLAIINQKIPFNERNIPLLNQDPLLGKILMSNHTLEREKIKKLFKID